MFAAAAAASASAAIVLRGGAAACILLVAAAALASALTFALGGGAAATEAAATGDLAATDGRFGVVAFNVLVDDTVATAIDAAGRAIGATAGRGICITAVAADADAAAADAGSETNAEAAADGKFRAVFIACLVDEPAATVTDAVVAAAGCGGSFSARLVNESAIWLFRSKCSLAFSSVCSKYMVQLHVVITTSRK